MNLDDFVNYCMTNGFEDSKKGISYRNAIFKK